MRTALHCSFVIAALLLFGPVVLEGLITAGNHVKVSAADDPRTAGISTIAAAGSLLIAGFANVQNVDCSDAVDSDPDETWTKLTASSSAFYVLARITYVANPTGDASQTFGCTSTGTLATVMASSWIGVKTSSPFDVENGGYSFGTSQATGTMTPSEDCELVIVVASHDDTGAQSADQDMIKLDETVYSAGVNYGGTIWYKILGAGTSGVGFSVTVSGANKGRAVRGATFKAASCVSGVSSILLLNN